MSRRFPRGSIATRNGRPAHENPPGERLRASRLESRFIPEGEPAPGLIAKLIAKVLP